MSFDIDALLAAAYNRDVLKESNFLTLCDKALEIFEEEPTVVIVDTPVTVCGDIHGQFYDLLQLFKMGGTIPNTKYVFMGDYVDRGYYSLETITLFLCLKVKYPDHITMLRGNHESRQITHEYGFFEECQKRYGNVLPYNKCMDVFDCLPVAALINDEILCVHGGLSPDLHTLDQIQLINRREEIPNDGIFCDLMWSDPDNNLPDFRQSPRGAGYIFGYKVTREFSQLNGLSLICRAHQLIMEGYKHSFPDSSLVTVWSAPNYCYRSGNVASILKLDDSLTQEFITFTEVPSALRQTPPQQQINYFL